MYNNFNFGFPEPNDSNIGKKFKYIEEKLDLLYQLVQNLQSTTNNRINNIDKNIEKLNDELESIKNQISDLNIKIRSIIDQLSLFALSDRVEYIERLLDYIDPTNFVTRNEIEKIIEKKIREYFGNYKAES